MYQLRCTQKAQDLIELDPCELSEVTDESHVLGNWYMHTFIQDERNCLFFLEESTFMSFILVDFKKVDTGNINEIFKDGLLQLLESEGIPLDILSSFQNAPASVQFTKTVGNKLLARVNNKVTKYKESVCRNGGLGECDLLDVAAQINREPQKEFKWAFSAEVFHELLGSNITNASTRFTTFGMLDCL